MPNSPVPIPQKAAFAVIRLLQTLISATGPQLEAKTVPMNNIIQKTFGGRAILRAKTAMLIAPVSARVRGRPVAPFSDRKSLLRLKPTSDKNVEAEERAAAKMPASSIAPLNCSLNHPTYSSGWGLTL